MWAPRRIFLMLNLVYVKLPLGFKRLMMYKFWIYRSQTTKCIHITKKPRLLLCNEIAIVSSENHNEYTNTQHGQNKEL
jgi:hypothetical protein